MPKKEENKSPNKKTKQTRASKPKTETKNSDGTKKAAERKKSLPQGDSKKKNIKGGTKQKISVSKAKKKSSGKILPAPSPKKAKGERAFMEMGKGGPMIRKILQSPRMRDTIKGFMVRRQGSLGKEDIQFEAFSKPMDFFQKMGFLDAVDTSSSREELIYYRQRLEYRADWLEVILEDSLKELEQIEKVLAGKTPPEPEKAEKKE